MGGGEWAFSWGAQDDAESLATLQHAIELGINWIDTAAVYGLGHSEEIVGRALKTLHPRPLVATKFSRRWDASGAPYSDISEASIRLEVENSLQRLDIEVIDLYQMHWPRPDEQLESAWQVVGQLVKEGKVRYAGVCNFSVSQLERILPIHPVASLQPPYSMLRREVENDLLAFCAKHQIGVVAYSPMQKGILTDKFSRAFVNGLPADDHRTRDPNFQEPKLTQHLDLVAGLQRIASQHGRSVAEIAIAWVLRRPEVTSAIVGARRPSQIEETVRASGWKLTETELAEIEALLARL
jgi:aryl-alcohol dehydrogenase-like predicted oxidoreductase